MKNKSLEQQLLSIRYNEDADAVMLRYLVLQLLEKYASAYKEMRRLGKSMELLQQFKKLETAHAIFKTKCRNRAITEDDFRVTRNLALEHTGYVYSYQSMLQAA